MNAWELIKTRLASTLSPDSYQNWVSRTQFSRAEGDIVYVSVPDEATRSWIESEYAQRITSVLRSLGAAYPFRNVIYETPFHPDSFPGNFAPPREDSDAPGSLLNPRFTFESFVVGSCNQLAHAAAKAVASNPSRSYNPLFIYGGTGMGKTHLMHAIGRELYARGSMRIIYTSSERFTNEVVTGIRFDKMATVRQRYRSADVLLIDDIQLLGTKDRTQEEFFHTFNELHEHQKQIVISSDAPPRNIPGLVERLSSRFEWGLLADIQSPDLETKMAILEKKAEAEGIHLPLEVSTFVASRTKSNVRELEGSFNKLVAYSSLTGTPITLAMAQNCLKHLFQAQERRITIDAIQRAVAEKFDMKVSQLKEKSNTKAVVYPRQIAMYLIKELTHASLPEIGRIFGGKHHTTVLHSISVISGRRQNDPDCNRIVHSLIDSLQ